jgi:hypothetical protein
MSVSSSANPTVGSRRRRPKVPYCSEIARVHDGALLNLLGAATSDLRPTVVGRMEVYYFSTSDLSPLELVALLCRLAELPRVPPRGILTRHRLVKTTCTTGVDCLTAMKESHQ